MSGMLERHNAAAPLPLAGRRVAIIGGGVGGLAAAVRLSQQGWRVKVFEREVSRKRVGHSFILADAGLEALVQLGLGDDAARCGSPLRAYELFAPDGPRLLTTALSSARGIRRQELIDVLEAAVPPGVVELGRAVDGLEYDADGVARAVRFTEGSSHEADLFLAADGIRSPTRAQLFPEARLTDVQVKELVCHVEDRALADLLGPVFRKYQCPQGGRSLGMLPSGDGVIVWFVQLDVGRWPGSIVGAAAIEAIVRREFGAWGGLVGRLLDATDFREAHTWTTADMDPLPALYRRNVALVGDAAHAFLPFTSHGVSAALVDSLALGDCLSAAEGCIETGLAAYSRARGPDIARVVVAGRTLRDRFLYPKRFTDEPAVPLVQ